MIKFRTFFTQKKRVAININSRLMTSEEEDSINRVGPWKNTEEFSNVYNWLFGENSDRTSKQLAMEMLIVWKIRRQNLTPASVLSTLEILSIQLRDDPQQTDRKVVKELQTIYSTSFTRFLNYMSSIMQGRNLKTMYTTAKELGIESFLVDLRHACAHGQVIPSIDVFRRTANYCMEWLHDFYWERALNSMRDVSAQDVRVKASIDFEIQAKSLVKIYDITCEALYRRYKLVREVDGNLDDGSFQLLEEYATNFKNNKLRVILANVTNDLNALINEESKIRGHSQIYCDIMCDSKYFFETASKFDIIDDDNGKRIPKAEADFVGIHQNLFRSMAACGFIEMFFKALIDICENEHETDIRRMGATFWTNKIVDGFLLLRDVKRLWKTRKEKNSKSNIDLSLINTNDMSEDIRRVYKNMGVNCNGVLIFGDTVQRPWGLGFGEDFINERILKTNKYTKHMIEKLINLSKHEMADDQETLMEWISIYVDEYVTDMDISTDSNKSLDANAQSLGDYATLIPVGEVKRYGIWSEIDDDADWATCPLGRVPWE